MTEPLPLEVVILRYLDANWADRVEHFDRLVMAAGLANAIQDPPARTSTEGENT